MFKEKVLLKMNGTVEVIAIEEIEKKSDLKNIKNNLYCSFKNCDCKMMYVPKGKRRAYFKTWIGHDHIEECIDFFERLENQSPTSSRAENSTRLSEEHKTRILREMNKLKKESEQEKEARKRKRKERKASQVTNATKTVNELDKVRPVTGKNEDSSVSGNRNPRVKRRYSINAISKDDINNAVAVSDKVYDVEVDNQFAVVTLTDDSKANYFKIYFEQTFFAESTFNIINVFSILKNRIQNDSSIEFSCVGNIEKRNEHIVMTAHEEIDVRINGLRMFQFAAQQN